MNVQGVEVPDQYVNTAYVVSTAVEAVLSDLFPLLDQLTNTYSTLEALRLDADVTEDDAAKRYRKATGAAQLEELFYRLHDRCADVGRDPGLYNDEYDAAWKRFVAKA